MNDKKWIKRPGESIGDYVVMAPIGKGGMGEIYLCRDVRLNRNLAVKLIQKRGAVDFDARERFLQEARLLAQAHHPNIATIFTLGEDETSVFIAMEFIEGESLHTLIRECRLSYSEIVTIICEIGQALQVAHEQGILHRDLKPTNILVDRYGFSKLIDFGIASGRNAKRASDSGGLVEGTLNYMAPELFSGAPASVATDVYALGLVLLEMITCEFPFRRENQNVTIDAIKAGQLWLPPAGLIPEELLAVIKKAAHVDPAQRYRSVVEMINALKLVKFSNLTDACLRPLRKAKLGPYDHYHALMSQSGLERWAWPIALSLAVNGWQGASAGFSTTIIEERIPKDELLRAVEDVKRLRLRAEEGRVDRRTSRRKRVQADTTGGFIRYVAAVALVGAVYVLSKNVDWSALRSSPRWPASLSDFLGSGSPAGAGKGDGAGGPKNRK